MSLGKWEYKENCGCSLCKSKVDVPREYEESVPKNKDVWAVQVDGNHYKKYEIQPTEYCQKNRLRHCESNIVKYATRHQDKDKALDILKLIHYAEFILKMDYPEEYDEYKRNKE